MVKGFKQIASLTMGSRVLGMVRDIAYSRYLGAGSLMDAWTIAFKIPNLSRRLFGEGAASASFIPVYSELLENDESAARDLANTVVTAVFVLLAGIVLVGWGLLGGYSVFAQTNAETDLVISLSSLMLPYTLMICVVAILGGMLQVHKHFAAPAAAPIVLNLFIIIPMVIAGQLLSIPGETIVFLVAFAVLIAGLVQILMQLIPLKRSGVNVRPSWQVKSDGFRKIMILMGPMILGLTVTQLNTLADDLIAWFFSGSEIKGEFFTIFGSQVKYPLWRGSVSYLYYAQRLYQLPLGVFGISLATAIFPVMSRAAARNDMKELTDTISRGIRAAFFIALPATAGLVILARPIVAVLFQNKLSFFETDSISTSWTLIFYALGLSGYFLQQILTRAFYSLQDSKMPARTALIAVNLNIVLNLILIWFLGTGGLGLSTAICSFVQVILLAGVLRKRFGSAVLHKVFSDLFKTIIGTLIMATAGYAVIYLMRQLPLTRAVDILRIIIVMLVTISTYTIFAKATRHEMLALVSRGKK